MLQDNGDDEDRVQAERSPVMVVIIKAGVTTGAVTTYVKFRYTSHMVRIRKKMVTVMVMVCGNCETIIQQRFVKQSYPGR